MINCARKTSFDSLSKKNMSARTVLQRSLKSTERAESRRKRKEFEEPDEAPEILDLNEGRLKYRFIKDPKLKNSQVSLRYLKQLTNTSEEVTSKHKIS